MIMLNKLDWLNPTSTLVPLTLSMGLLVALATPVKAQVSGSIYIQVGQPQPNTVIYSNPIPNTTIYGTPYPTNNVIYGAPNHNIYGSPIPSPVPVDPYTGQLNNKPSAYYAPSYPNYGAYPGQVTNSTLLNPTVINSSVSNSVLVNPVFVNPQGYPTRVERSRIIYRSY